MGANYLCELLSVDPGDALAGGEVSPVDVIFIAVRGVEQAVYRKVAGAGRASGRRTRIGC